MLTDFEKLHTYSCFTEIFCTYFFVFCFTRLLSSSLPPIICVSLALPRLLKGACVCIFFSRISIKSGFPVVLYTFFDISHHLYELGGLTYIKFYYFLSLFYPLKPDYWFLRKEFSRILRAIKAYCSTRTLNQRERPPRVYWK